MSKFKKGLIITIIFTILGYAAGIGIAFATGANKEFSTALLTDKISLICLGCGFLGGFVVSVMMKGKKKTSDKNVGETATGEKFDVAHDSKFIDASKLKNDPELLYTTWDKLPSMKKTGFVFRNVRVGNHYEINMKYETHALVIGTTGTGKTQILADPTIRILAHSGEKPSLVIADPKGELYEDNANILRKEGYKIVILNLDDPYSSSKWNPMEIAYRIYQRAGNLISEVKTFSNCSPEDVGYVKFSAEELNGATYGEKWYGFEGKAFPNNEILKKELHARQVQLEDEAKANIRNIGISLIPVLPDVKDPVWPRGCQDLITGIMLGMLEDSRDERLGMTLDKFNFYNLYKIAMKRDNGENQLDSVTKFSEGRNPITSNVHDLMATVCGTSPVTQKSFLGTLGSSLGTTLGDDGVLYMTSGTDIDFEKFPEEPTAFFLRIPDHKTERHPLATLCLSQLYKVLVDVANRTVDPVTNKRGRLKRKIFFILDEFGNLPPIEGFGTKVTVARSRNIFFEIILQSYKQLDIKYGPDEAQNIRGNFQMEIFLGSEDPSTIQSFSEACGEVTVFHKEESKSKSDKGEQGETVSTSVQRSRRPLIDKAELRTLPQNTVIAKIFRKEILKEVMTPFWKTEEMEKDPAKQPIALAKSLDYESIFYDIEKRNQIVLRYRPPFGR